MIAGGLFYTCIQHGDTGGLRILPFALQLVFFFFNLSAMERESVAALPLNLVVSAVQGTPPAGEGVMSFFLLDRRRLTGRS